MEFSLKITSFKKILCIISDWGEELVLRMGENCIWMQVLYESIAIIQIELSLDKLIQYKLPKEDYFFSFDIKTLKKVIKFADIDSILTVVCTQEGKLAWVKLTNQEKDKQVEICLSESNPDTQGFLIDTEYKTSVSIQTKELKRIVQNFSMFYEDINIQFKTKKQIVLSANNDKSNILLTLSESARKPSALRLKCSSGKLISASGTDNRKVRDFNVTKQYHITVDLKYMRKMIESIENLRDRPSYIKSLIYNENFPLQLEFELIDIAVVKYFIALKVLEDNTD